MNSFAIDLSMRSTGVTYFKDNDLVDFKVISNKELKDEALFIHNIHSIFEFINQFNLKEILIKIEGLSLRSLSGEKDKIYGQFWYLRCKLKELYPEAIVKIVTVKEWRSPLFTKAENKEISDAKKRYKKEKKKVKGLKGLDRKEAIAFNHELEMACDIKLHTFNKLPDDVKERFYKYVSDCKLNPDSVYDLTDSYFINKF